MGKHWVRQDCHIFACKYCDFTHDSSSYLNVHYQHVHSESSLAKRKAKCPALPGIECYGCNLSFNSNVYYKHRSEVHGDRWECLNCSVKFFRPQGLSNHVRVKHHAGVIKRRHLLGRLALDSSLDAANSVVFPLTLELF